MTFANSLDRDQAKLFDTLAVFLKDFFENVSLKTTTAWKISQYEKNKELDLCHMLPKINT